MQTATLTDVSIPAARCRAYGFLAALLRYPDADLEAALLGTRLWERQADALRTLAGESFTDALDKLEQLHRRALDPANWPLSDAYFKVFGASLRGRVVPYECEYGNNEIFQLSGDLSDIGAFYNAFGLKVGGKETERPDHIAVECEFMAFLCAREVSVRVDEEPQERVEIVWNAQRTFVRDHLGRWGISFARQLQTADAEGVYGAAAAVLEGVLTAETVRLGVERGPAFLALRPVPQADDPSNCISCGIPQNMPGQLPVNETEQDDAH